MCVLEKLEDITFNLKLKATMCLFFIDLLLHLLNCYYFYSPCKRRGSRWWELSLGHFTSLVQTEIIQQLFDGLSWNCALEWSPEDESELFVIRRPPHQQVRVRWWIIVTFVVLSEMPRPLYMCVPLRMNCNNLQDHHHNLANPYLYWFVKLVLSANWTAIPSAWSVPCVPC